MKTENNCTIFQINLPNPAMSNCYTSKHPGLNPLFLIFDIRTLWHSGLNARVSKCQKLRMVGYTSTVLNIMAVSYFQQSEKWRNERVKMCQRSECDPGYVVCRPLVYKGPRLQFMLNAGLCMRYKFSYYYYYIIITSATDNSTVLSPPRQFFPPLLLRCCQCHRGRTSR